MLLLRSRVDEPAEETLAWDGVDRWGMVEIVRGEHGHARGREKEDWRWEDEAASVVPFISGHLGGVVRTMNGRIETVRN